MIKAGSLFSGIGGTDLGFGQAGFEIVANEIDAVAFKTYRHNFSGAHLVGRDIKSVKIIKEF